jgi:hypothetical protein
LLRATLRLFVGAAGIYGALIPVPAARKVML